MDKHSFKPVHAIICTIVVIIAVSIAWVITSSRIPTRPASNSIPPMPVNATSTLRLTSPAFTDGGPLPAIYTCNGKDLIPPLDFSGAPAGTKSFALTLEDPDTSIGTYDHWVVFNIPPSTAGIKEGVAPVGIHGKGTSGGLPYVSPCPPSGVHHYIFTLYALSFVLPLPEGATKAEVLAAMKGYVLGEARLVGLYGKGS